MKNQTTDSHIILRRVERLERENRRLKEVGLLVLVLIGTLMLVGQALAKSRIARANHIIGPGAAGKIRSAKSIIRWQGGAAGVGQSPDSYPTKKEVVTTLKDADYAIRRFQEVAGRVNFNRWAVEYKFVDRMQEHLKFLLAMTRRSIARIEAIQSAKTVSGYDLFIVYDDLRDLDAGAIDVANGIRRYDTKDDSLGIELMDIATLELEASGKVRDIFWKQIQAEESELESCRSKPQE